MVGGGTVPFLIYTRIAKITFLSNFCITFIKVYYYSIVCVDIRYAAVNIVVFQEKLGVELMDSECVIAAIANFVVTNIK